VYVISTIYTVMFSSGYYFLLFSHGCKMDKDSDNKTLEAILKALIASPRREHNVWVKRNGSPLLKPCCGLGLGPTRGSKPQHQSMSIDGIINQIPLPKKLAKEKGML
ncbi:hypothetical protein ACJX0J_040688, partial [Zea mays]